MLPWPRSRAGRLRGDHLGPRHAALLVATTASVRDSKPPCQPERSEGSMPAAGSGGFFASLRMTASINVRPRNSPPSHRSPHVPMLRRFLFAAFASFAVLAGCKNVDDAASNMRDRLAGRDDSRTRTFRASQRDVYQAVRASAEKMGYRFQR